MTASSTAMAMNSPTGPWFGRFNGTEPPGSSMSRGTDGIAGSVEPDGRGVPLASGTPDGMGAMRASLSGEPVGSKSTQP